jgi:hypothetical protein
MTSVTQAARTAAQLRQAAQEVARLAALRGSERQLGKPDVMPEGKAADLAGQPIAVGDGRGQAMRAVKNRLAAYGFDVDGPESEAGRCLTITGLSRTTCDITVEDNGLVTWEYLPGGSADPDMVAGRVVHLLTGRPPLPLRRRDPGPEPRTGLKGLVGRRLVARGMAVRLEIFEDQVSFEVSAEISVTNPRCPERGRVHVADDGALMWECDSGEHGVDAGAMVGVIAAIVSADIGQGCVQRTVPAPGGRL